MNCPQCGEICVCSAALHPAAAPECPPVGEPPLETSGAPAQNSDTDSWRSELSARLDRYRARHRPRPPRYPSLRLKFDPPASDDSSFSQQSFNPMSEHALALDSLVQETPLADTETGLKAKSTTSAVESSTQPASATAPAVPKPAAKIIEFPRFAPPVPEPDQLAEPVFDRPRILEVPEFEPPAPALGGILIEAVEPKDIEKRSGIDTPLQGAPVVRRLIAAAFDGLVVMVASALFAYIFWKVTGIQPPRFQLFGLAAGLLSTLWAAYEYLMLVYSGSSFGLRAAGLQLTRFDGSPTSRSLRRWRVFASYLSAISLGMGYAWVFLDEDSLCWHDRITHTYLAKKS